MRPEQWRKIYDTALPTIKRIDAMVPEDAKKGIKDFLNNVPNFYGIKTGILPSK